MESRSFAFALALLFVGLPDASTAIMLPSHIASSMVVQRNQPFLLQGVDAPHAVVTATFLGKDFTAKADPAGAFSITLPAQKEATTPATIAVSTSSGLASVVLEDVLFGDVFLSSGQSNMELTVSWCYNYAAAVKSSSQYGAILRIAQVELLPEYYNVTSAQTNLTMGIPWSRASPANVAGMSGIAYFTALEMIKANPTVPIGAIASSWGGTAMEPWMPPHAFVECRDAPGSSSDHEATVGVLPSDPGLYSPGKHPEVELAAGPPSIKSTLWNSMIAPLLPLRLSGFYWYQGESNCGQRSFSRCFPAMITEWRNQWKAPDLPFIFFQLAPWPALDAGPSTGFGGVLYKSQIAEQRAAQVNATNLPNVGMVVAADRGDSAGAFHPIHPPVKEELSHRAFLVTDNLVYGNTSSPLQGPQPVKVTFDKWDASWGDFHYGTGAKSYVCQPKSGFLCGGYRVEFDQDIELASMDGEMNAWVAGGLAPSRPSSNDLLLLSDVNGTQFQRAQITSIVNKNTLQLNATWAFGSSPPKFLKYADSDYPAMPIYNRFGLPTPPFLVPIDANSSRQD